MLASDGKKNSYDYNYSQLATWKSLADNGDVRLQNFVFTTTEKFLIDFDLARPEGSSYPVGYNVYNERHTGAKATLSMLKIHDRFSIAYSSAEGSNILSVEVPLSMIIGELESLNLQRMHAFWYSIILIGLFHLVCFIIIYPISHFTHLIHTLHSFISSISPGLFLSPISHFTHFDLIFFLQ